MSVVLFAGGITNKFPLIPFVVPVAVTDKYVLVLLRNTQNPPSVVGALTGKKRVLNPEFVILYIVEKLATVAVPDVPVYPAYVNVIGIVPVGPVPRGPVGPVTVDAAPVTPVGPVNP